MEENNKLGEYRNLMSEEDFKKYIEEHKSDPHVLFSKGVLSLRTFEGVKKFKSIRRAIRRGHVSIFGEVYPHRPFKNTSNNRYKRIIYGQLKGRNSVV